MEVHQGLSHMRKHAVLAILAAFSVDVSAQTLGFDVDSLAGRYVVNMLTYAGVEVVDCLPEVPELPSHIEDYLCVEDVDDIPFMDDVDKYLAAQPGIVKESSGWYPVNSSMFQHIILNNGYDITLATDPTTNFVIVLGDTGE